MSVLSQAIDALFADPNLAADAVWRAGGMGVPLPVRLILRQPDRVGSFGETRIWTESVVADVRTVDVPNLSAADTFDIDGETFVVQGEPVRDAARLVWTAELRKP